MRHRLADTDDARLYFDWANDPLTRQQSFNSEPISWEDHEVWFARKVADPNALLLVFETVDDVPVGQVRFEKQADGTVIIGISVDAAFRGKGLATELLINGCISCQKRWNGLPILAYIKPDNKASIRTFEKTGFESRTQTNNLNRKSVELVKV